jgi:HSP20 family molecular chaperone IbpA
MSAMRAVGHHKLPLHAHVQETEVAYLIDLDVSDFAKAELSVETLGPHVVVRGDQLAAPRDEGKPFCIHERLEESFRLPDDADPDAIAVFYNHGVLEIRVPRRRLEPHRLPIEVRRPGFVNPKAVPA